MRFSVSRELGLELAEVLVRLQLRVRLGDREQAAERLAQDPFRRGGLGRAAAPSARSPRASVTASNVPRSCAA